MASVATLQFNVDIKLDFICVLDPQVGRLAALKNTASIGGSFAIFLEREPLKPRAVMSHSASRKDRRYHRPRQSSLFSHDLKEGSSSMKYFSRATPYATGECLSHIAVA